MTKTKSKKFETGLHKYIYETAKVSNAMGSIAKFFSMYGSEESGETGAMLSVIGSILDQANGFREVRRRMLSNVGANLSHLKEVYRDARETLIAYKEAQRRLKAARTRYVTRKKLITTRKLVRSAKYKVDRREAEFLAMKRELKKVLHAFDKKLRKALLYTFFQLVRCEMFMAARVLEIFSESYSKLEKWNTEKKELKSEPLIQNQEKTKVKTIKVGEA